MDELNVSERVGDALRSREALHHDFFGGWEPADVELFNRYGCPKPGAPGYLTDFFGVRTPTDCVPWAAGADGAASIECPIPDDGVRAEAIEYYALLRALELSAGLKFSMIELGASYAPWACLGGCLALREGRRQIKIRAVEASKFFIDKIHSNWTVNGLLPNGYVNGGQLIACEAVHAAVGVEAGTMFFPVVSSAVENGGQAVHVSRELDYVGRSVAHQEVRALTLEQIFEGFDVIDFLHCDIQGAELEVLTRGIGLLSDRVRCVFVGTHSRAIEGGLIDSFHQAGWTLLRERPTMFSHRSDLADVIGMTTRDGGQFWVNPRFS
jgi:FkbM family methyltransferase